jgi:hypothetical protein
MIAACGLDCEECDIRVAAGNLEVAEGIVQWFKTEKGVEIDPGNIRCDACRGDRERHWSPDCWILQCCVDDRGLESCSACEDFPCQALVEWAATSERYSEALERLKDDGD